MSLLPGKIFPRLLVPDISPTAVKFPDISRFLNKTFSRQVVGHPLAQSHAQLFMSCNMRCTGNWGI